MSNPVFEKLWTARLDGARLHDWLATPRINAPYAIVERLDMIDFPGPSEKIDPEMWPQGRIFGEYFEIRWEGEGNNYHVWYIGRDDPGEGFQVHDLPNNSKTEECILWGASEARLSHPPNYRAIPDQPGRGIIIRLLFIDKNENPIYYRFQKMERRG